MAEKKILFIIGSPNQTTQMHQVANQLPEYDCYFSQLYSSHPLIRTIVKTGYFDNTILAGKFKRDADAYLEQHGLRNDYAAKVYGNDYDLVVFCSDMLVTRSLRKKKTIWVQEGMTDPIKPWGRISRKLGLPAYLAGNTAFNGAGNLCDIYCAASEGYKKQFARLGTDAQKIFVTGMPNYDHLETFIHNDFPHRGYVMVATSDARETYKKDDREQFIRNCVQIAAGRRLVFKLHPNEVQDRAIREIKTFAPADTLIYTEGNTNEMIANCSELITQYSTVVYVGIALGKPVHSYFNVEELKRLAPIQNGGQSAANIATLCRNYIEYRGSLNDFLAQQHQTLSFQTNSESISA